MCIFAASFDESHVELCKEKHLYRFTVEFAQITIPEESSILMPFAHSNMFWSMALAYCEHG